MKTVLAKRACAESFKEERILIDTHCTDKKEDGLEEMRGDYFHQSLYDRGMVQEPWEICPPKERLQAYAHKQLEGKKNEWTYRHLKFCQECLRYMATFKKIPSPDQIISSGGPLGWLKKLYSRLFNR